MFAGFGIRRDKIENRKSSVTLTPSGLPYESPEFLSWLQRAF
ncbi:hypothetical protein LEP1GSC041_4268 [Leptospira noguchii str. 2006001870]|uniref:Uncharacterized protein n=1 Tax=Leptospira noguchii serovar Autumnalis str. ZUN142 TaxID=1085540 RepID=M6UPA8_9LEPT|nr:hypothetical protein LEP1GSC041_4268 [Leptospira noguchii str. 2006001870]EMI70569.1 hypothetical protein LEP1GSC072_0882 [Leptospira noguchii str. Bonito]EMO28956.1 hypothetical protein LEP1GSC170_4501 [Leptospira interrogans serovar Bataviae str. HAI135]EMO39073.1 hypothetical protein LEP1GSC186_0249 [Leptospira noguchii serovar Autumnalis str. ZUN142]EMS83139.1 hypothetical protein LEP1GSC073_1345 [Leptospira noguchii str. Cascata]